MGLTRFSHYVATAVVVALTSACSGTDSGPVPPPAPPAPPTPPPRQAHAQPKKFDAKSVVLPSDEKSSGSPIANPSANEPPVALHGMTAYIALPDSMHVVDTTNGHTRARIRPRNQPLEVTGGIGGSNEPTPAPVLTQLGGKPAMLFPFTVKTQGHGTTPGGKAIELTAVDATTNQVMWTTELSIPDWATWTQGLSAKVLGVQHGTAVVGVTSKSGGMSFAEGTVYGVDLATRTQRWQQDKFNAQALEGGMVVGTEQKPNQFDQQVTALNATDGVRKWSMLNGTGFSVSSAGPRLVAVGSMNPMLGRGTLHLLDVATGATVNTAQGAAVGADCDYDGVSVTVCSTSGLETRAFAVDSTNGTLLWQLPEPANKRVAPKVTAVQNGLVYGQTENGPVILDAKTGADDQAKPRIAPVILNEYVAVAEDPMSGDLRAHAITG